MPALSSYQIYIHNYYTIFIVGNIVIFCEYDAFADDEDLRVRSPPAGNEAAAAGNCYLFLP